MSVEDPNVIDFVTQDPTGTVVLVLVEGRKWDGSEDRLRELKDKIDNYEAYVVDGQLVEHYPELAAKRVVFELRHVGQPDSVTAKFISTIRAALQEKGIGFTVREIGARPSA